MTQVYLKNNTRINSIPKGKETMIYEEEDIQWVEEVFCIPKGYKAFIIIGNEDSPDCICAYKSEEITWKTKPDLFFPLE